MGYKDPEQQKAYQRAWFKRTYVPHPKPLLTPEERLQRQRSAMARHRSAMSQTQRGQYNANRRAKYADKPKPSSGFEERIEFNGTHNICFRCGAKLLAGITPEQWEAHKAQRHGINE